MAERTNRKRSVFWFIGFHIAAIAAVLLFPFYRVGASVVFAVIPSCILHDWFHIYCPLCGGTRAVEELLHFHWLESLRFHPFVMVFALLIGVWYGIAWVRLVRGKSLFVEIPKPLSISLAIGLILFWILRNFLLIAFHIDPVGDLVGFWN